MSQKRKLRISYEDIENAFEYVNWGAPYENMALLNLETGKMLYRSEFSGEEDGDWPEEIDDSQYLEIPHRNDLDLGKELVFRFVENKIPELLNEVARIFRQRGAYRRYKDFLERHGQLQDWYDYENAAHEEALMEWGEVNNLEIVKGLGLTPL